MKVATISEFIELIEFIYTPFESPCDKYGGDAMPPDTVRNINNERIGEAFQKAKQIYLKGNSND